MNINLSQLISTPERERILTRLLYESKPVNLHKMARDAHVSVSQVHKYIGICKKGKIVKDGKIVDSPTVRALRVLKNLNFLEKAGLVSYIKSMSPEVKGIMIYGGWANGTNDENSDIDICIFLQSPLDDLGAGKIRLALEKRLKMTVDLFVLTNEKMQQLKAKNPNMYYSLYHSLKLWGDGSW